MPESSGIKKFFANNWEKMALWTVLVGLFFLLKPFLLLVFETFLITYIMKNLVEHLVNKYHTTHRLTTVLVFLLLVTLIGAGGAWIIPRFIRDSKHILTQIAGANEQETSTKMNDFIENTMRKVVGPAKAQSVIDSSEYRDLLDSLKMDTTETIKTALPNVLKGLLHVVRIGWEIVLSLILAILFSFILVLDWRRIATGMKQLECSRIRTFYLGAAPHLQAFATVLGKAFRAQAIIAACNAILTLLGLWLFEVPNLTLLTTIVFLCGFIPILGTFMSSIPILLFGAQTGGLPLILKLIILIAFVHMFEAYVLNPRITAGVLHVHPMLVLVLLLVGERFFGIWGMVLGVPIGYYVIKVLTEKDDRLVEDPNGNDGPGKMEESPPQKI